MKKLIVILVTFFTLFPTVSFGVNGIGENVGSDLFKKINEGTYKLKNTFIEKEVEDSAKKLNGIIGPICGNKETCFDEAKNFTKSEIDNITLNGNVGIIMTHLKSKFFEKGGITTDKIYKLTEEIKKYSEKINEQIDTKVEQIQKIGSIGLYTDGTLDNSDYDLMHDLEQIHKVIFTEEIPYNGVENNKISLDIASALKGESNTNLLSNGNSSGILSNNPTSNNQNENNKIGANGSSKLPFSPNSTTTNTASCKTGVTITNLDSNFYNDINNQLLYGINGNNNPENNLSTNTSSSSKNNTGSVLSPNTSNNNPTSGGDGRSLFDSFACDSFFCIDIAFKMYTQNLLGGGKSNSIESILDKNFKIAYKFAATSLVQSVMTHDFLELSILKNLNLPSMAHIGVVVTKLPPPILNLKSKDAPSPNSITEFSDKQFLINVFSQYKIDYKTQNDISADMTDQCVINCVGLSTEACQKKIKDCNNFYLPPKEYTSSIESKLKTGYFDGFDKDLIEFVSFTKSFVDTIGTVEKGGLMGVIKKMKEEKCTN